MIKSFLIAITVVFAVLGLAEFLHFLRLLICGPKHRTKSVLVIFLKRGSAVNQLDFVVSQQRWLGGLFADKIVAFYNDLSDDEFKSCSLIAADGSAVIEKENGIKNIEDLIK